MSKPQAPRNLKAEKKYWQEINSIICKQGLPPIPEKIPSLASLTDAFIDLLSEYSLLKSSYKELRDQVNSNGFHKPTDIDGFKSHRKTASSPYDINDNAHNKATSYKLGILEEVKNIIGTKDYDNIVPDLKKIKQVMMTLPEIENFMNCVCKELLPNLKSPDYLEQALSKIKSLSSMQKEFEFVIEENIQMKTAVDYFAKLFDVQDRGKIMQTIDCVFYFVHEMKEFLDVSGN